MTEWLKYLGSSTPAVAPLARSPLPRSGLPSPSLPPTSWRQPSNKPPASPAGRTLGVVAMLLGCAAAVQAQQYAYVANLGSNNVSVIDTGTSGIVAMIPVGDNPNGLAATLDGRLVYVTNFLSDDVSVIDTRSNTVIATVSVGSGPVGIAVTPNGTAAYVTNRGSNTVSVIDVARNVVTATIGVGSGPDAIAIVPSGAAAYVTNSFSKMPGTVSVIDTASNAVTAIIEVGRNPNRVAITPDGAFAYVTNFRSWNVSVIDTAAGAVTTTIPLFGRPSGVAVNPNGAELYLVTLGGRVELIDTDTNALEADVAVGDSPYGIATTRDGRLAYVANFGAGSVSVIDLGAESATTNVPVGDKPFAVVVSCTGSICTEPPFTPRPTRTPTVTPTITRTPAITVTPTVTSPEGASVVFSVGSATGKAGQQVSFSVTLQTSGQAVGGTQNDIGFDAHAPIAVRANGKPDCTVNPSIDKNGTAFAFQPGRCTYGVDCTAVRALVLSVDNSTPIPDGAALYTCRVAIAANAPAGTYALPSAPFSAVASSPDGTKIPVVVTDGAITVIAASGQTARVQAAQSTGATQSTGTGCAIDGSGDRGIIWQLLIAAVALGWRRRFVPLH